MSGPDAADAVPALLVRRLDARAAVPQRMTDGAAGLDLACCLPTGPVRLEPGERRLVPTGLALAIPPGYEGQVRARSGLAVRHGIAIVNAPCPPIEWPVMDCASSAKGNALNRVCGSSSVT